MLSYMRKNAKSWIVTIPIAIIILVFIFFYGFSDVRTTDQDKVLASIGSRKITLEAYRTAYKNALEFYRSMYKNQFTEEMLEQMNLRQQVLENLIDREVLLQEADNLGISIPAEEVRRAIVITPAFQENGVFSQRLYERILNSYGIAAADYEQDKQKELRLAKLRDMLISAVKVSDLELRDYYNMQNEEARIEYAVLNAQTQQEDITVSEAEIAAFYEANKEAFRIPEEVQVKYIIFNPQDFEGKMEVAEEEIKEYYESDLEKFSEPRRIKARHILFKLDAKAAPENEKAIEAKASSVLERLRKGESFEKLAKEFSEDKASAERGGDLGFFKKGDMVKPFEEAASALKPGELSALVRTAFGFHIIRVDEIKEARTKSVQDVRGDIERELRADKAQSACQAEAKRAYNRLFKDKLIEAYAEKKGLTVKTTDFFPYGMAPEGLDAKELFSKEAFALAPGEIAPAFAVDQRYILIKLEGKREARIPPLEDIYEKIKAEVKKEQKTRKAKEKAEQILAALIGGQLQWGALADKYKLKAEQATIKRMGESVPGIGRAQEIKAAVFEQGRADQLLKKVFETEQGSVLVLVKDRQLPTDTAFGKERDQIYQLIMQKKGLELFDQFLQARKAAAELYVNSKLLPSA